SLTTLPRPPPPPTLFPYTTLFRSLGTSERGIRVAKKREPPLRKMNPHPRSHRTATAAITTARQCRSTGVPGRNLATNQLSTILRSEEHTSELQSRSDLVCRLLLEK